VKSLEDLRHRLQHDVRLVRRPDDEFGLASRSFPGPLVLGAQRLQLALQLDQLPAPSPVAILSGCFGPSGEPVVRFQETGSDTSPAGPVLVGPPAYASSGLIAFVSFMEVVADPPSGRYGNTTDAGAQSSR
jgi:hypothetical protein